MKTSHITLLFLFMGILPLPLFAQLDQGQSFIAGSFYLSNNSYRTSESDKTSSSKDLGGSFRGGYLLKNNLALTIGFNVGQGKGVGYNEIFTQAEIRPDGQPLFILQLADTKSRSNGLGFSVGLNRYISLKERLSLVLDGNLAVSFSSGRNTQQIPGQSELTTEWREHYFSLNFNPGLIYFLNPRFGLSGNFGGFFMRFQPKSGQNDSSTLSGGFSTSGVLGIGLNYFFK